MPHGERRAIDASGTVHVSVGVAAPVERAWLALRDPHELSRWFGDLAEPWLAGKSSKIEFGDGDFFDITTREVVEGKRIEFAWSFLGLGLPSLVRWTARARPDGAEVEVEDRDSTRTSAEADQLLAGWSDFFGRLTRYLETGQSTRYDWRDDIDGSIDLPASSFAALGTDLDRWLPIASDGFQTRWFFIIDDEGPRRYPLATWQHAPNERIDFAVEVTEHGDLTTGEVTLVRIGSQSRLSFSHRGWRSLDLPDRQASQLRRRFAQTWIGALKQAGELASVA